MTLTGQLHCDKGNLAEELGKIIKAYGQYSTDIST